jgi:CubicO group peptidase (beta-lactamase class C family)
MRERGIQGLSLAVVKKGRVIKAQGYGISNIELNVPAGPQTVYRIGSTGKLFVATGIMLLVEENKVRLDDSVSKYLEGTPETWRGITIRQLLSHTSGLRHDAPGYDDFKVQSEASVIRSAYVDPLLFAPGTKAAYSNLGYFILAEIITKASGERWTKYLAERIFKPLQMTATDTANTAAIIMNRAAGYVRDNGTIHNVPIPLALRPSGAFLSNVRDLAKFDAALYTDQILRQSSLQQMWQPVRETDTGEGGVKGASFGFGWVVAQVNGHRVVLKGGSYPGFNAAFARFVDDSLRVVLLANTDKSRLGTLAYEVAGMYIHGLAYRDIQ